MRGTRKRWVGWMVAAVLAGAGTQAAAAAQDGCFKQVFQQRSAQGSWVVRQCEDDKGVRYRIAFGTGQEQLAIPDPDGIVDVAYRLVGRDTLLIDASAERGGHAFLVHPVAGSATLSVAAFDYLSGDEESLVVRQEGARIRASTTRSAHVFSVDAKGVLAPVPQARAR